MERLRKLLKEKLGSMVPAFSDGTLKKKHTIALGRETQAGKEVLRIDLGNSNVRFMDKKTLLNFIKELQGFATGGVE